MRELWPDEVLAPGRGDAAGVLALWLLRRSFLTLLWVSAIVVVVTGTVASPEDLDAQVDTQVSSMTEVREVVLSPTSLLLLSAPAARFASAWLAWAIAFPLAWRLQVAADHDLERSRWHPVPWLDRARLASGLRSVRWTSSVRRRARARLGRAGTFVQVADVVLIVAGIVLFPVAMVVLFRSLA